MIPTPSPARISSWLLTLLVTAVLSGCVTTSKVISPGPLYSGIEPVRRLSIYVFLDVRPEYVHPAFRKTVEEGLAATFTNASVPSQQLWSLDTIEGERSQRDTKSRSMGAVTLVSVGKMMQENQAAEQNFAPSHRLVVFPENFRKTGSGATLDVKWDILNARTGSWEWSVFTRTPVLSRNMKEDDAIFAARGLVDAISTEMRARSVIRK